MDREVHSSDPPGLHSMLRHGVHPPRVAEAAGKPQAEPRQENPQAFARVGYTVHAVCKLGRRGRVTSRRWRSMASLWGRTASSPR